MEQHQCTKGETIGKLEARMDSMEKRMPSIENDIKHIKYLIILGVGATLANNTTILSVFAKLF